MVRFISNIPIFRRLFIAFALASIIPSIVIVVLGNFYISSLNARSDAVKTSFDAQSIASQQQSNLQSMHELLQTRVAIIFSSLGTTLQDHELANSGALISVDLQGRVTSFDQALQNYLVNYNLATSSNMATIHNILLNDNPDSGNQIIDGQKSALASVSAEWPQYRQLQQAVLDQLVPLQDALDSGKTLSSQEINTDYLQAYSAWFKANNYFTALNNDWQRVVNSAVDMGKTVTNVGPSLTQPMLIATVIAIIFTVLITFGAGWIVNITITQPLRQLDMLTKRIAKGNTSARARVSSRDEIAKVAQAMNNMLDNIVHLIQEAQNQRDALQAQVEKLVSEVSGVGEGDLRVQAEVTADALGVLADSFNYMVEELGSLVIRVKMVAQEVENSTTMTVERMSQLVESADNQIRRINQAAVEIERMADSSRQVAERAQTLAAIAREARQTAQSGRESVQQTVSGMGRINNYVQDTAAKVQALGESSREINNIVDAISLIAQQTNRLALDAAIQAAMAGENGKGFKAVADDIRRLAERAKEQANTITRIVRGVREDIAEAAGSMRDTERETAAGTLLAEEAGTALQSIFSVVDRQAREIETINAMATMQLQSSNTVVQIMQGVSETTQQSSGSTREAATNMERLARLAEQLLASVEAFKLRDGMNTGYYAPVNVSVSPENEFDNGLTVSGVFRTVTATAQPVGSVGSPRYHALPPGPASQPSGPAPTYMPYQQNNGYGYGNGNGNGYNTTPSSFPAWPDQPQPQTPQQWQPQQPQPQQRQPQTQWQPQPPQPPQPQPQPQQPRQPQPPQQQPRQPQRPPVPPQWQ